MALNPGDDPFTDFSKSFGEESVSVAEDVTAGDALQPDGSGGFVKATSSGEPVVGFAYHTLDNGERASIQTRASVARVSEDVTANTGTVGTPDGTDTNIAAGELGSGGDEYTVVEYHGQLENGRGNTEHYATVVRR
jgi:hypothetical protein